MTFNVYYTNRAQPNSSFVNRAWYDSTKQDLYVELQGSVYQYRNVPENAFNHLVEAPSPGRYYQDAIKGKFHPGSRLGPVADLREMRAFPAVQDVTTARKSQGFASLSNVYVGPQRTPETPQLSLVKDVPTKVQSDERRYDFVFIIDSDETATERKHTIKAASEDAALDQLFELGDLLDQDIIPVSSTVYYD